MNLVGALVGPLAPGVIGETWNFQYWFRDANPQTTSNTSPAVAVEFCN